VKRLPPHSFSTQRKAGLLKHLVHEHGYGPGSPIVAPITGDRLESPFRMEDLRFQHRLCHDLGFCHEVTEQEPL
jgi:hypothetical protein